MDQMERIARFGNCGIAACALIETLKEGQIGDVLTDEQLTAIAGKSTAVGGAAYGSLMSAIEYCSRHFAVHWQRTPKAGAIKCLNAAEVLALSRSKVGSIRRMSRKTGRKLATVDYATLDNQQQTEARAIGAQLGTLAMFSQTGTTKKLVARSAQSVPDVGRLLDAFNGATNGDAGQDKA